ncbi:hypothetical protein BDR06DRAFT_966984 [Suillus hirtellus]|nr:hypothetical protein BDR06DRAFT_966984 [Suillus hirtellus]
MTARHNYDLSGSLLGTEVLLNSPVIMWKDGHMTILPAVYNDKQTNLCETVDIPIIQYLAKCPESTPHSKYVTHLSNSDISPNIIEDMVSLALSLNKPVVIRGIGQHSVEEELTGEYVNKHYSISPNRVVWIHDVKARTIDHMKVTMAGILKSFVQSMKNPDKIQYLSYVTNDDRNLDHGFIHGWNHMTYDVQITSNVHPESFTVKGWGLLHHMGFLTYPHHDAGGSLTWVRMEVGMKFWVEIAIKLGDFTENKVWIRANCHAEVITIMPGDTIIPPGRHFYHYGSMHLTKISQYLDVVVGDCSTNQGKQYCAKGGHKSAVADTETAPLSTVILAAIVSHLESQSASDQFERGELIVREKLDKALI